MQTPIEIEDSRLAVSEDIHVDDTEEGVKVTSMLKCKRHKARLLRGCLNVELLDLIGRILEGDRPGHFGSKRIEVNLATWNGEAHAEEDFYTGTDGFEA